MPLNQEPNPRFKLNTLAKQLHKQIFPTAPISKKLAHWAADAIEKYLSGKSKSLDAAFGLQKKRGTPGWPKARAKMAREAYKMLREGKSLHAIARELKRQGYKDAERATIKRVLEEWKVRLMSHEIAADLNPE